MRDVYIYKRARGGYLVMADRSYPHGEVVAVRDTLWGARRIAKKVAAQDSAYMLVEKHP